jgi:hypothetical protein
MYYSNETVPKHLYVFIIINPTNHGIEINTWQLKEWRIHAAFLPPLIHTFTNLSNWALSFQ